MTRQQVTGIQRVTPEKVIFLFARHLKRKMTCQQSLGNQGLPTEKVIFYALSQNQALS